MHIIIETGRVGWGRVRGIWDGLNLLWLRIRWGGGTLAEKLEDETKRLRGEG